MWLISATIPIVPITAVSASSSGMLAATSAPKVISRIRSVIGSEVTSARWKSLPIDVRDLLFGARFAELLDRETRVSGLRGAGGLQGRGRPVLRLAFLARELEAQQSRVPVGRDARLGFRPRRGSRTPACTGTAASRRWTSATTARKDGSVARSAGAAGSRTSSLTCFGKALSTAAEARPDSPTPLWEFSCVTVFAALPIMNTSEHEPEPSPDGDLAVLSAPPTRTRREVPTRRIDGRGRLVGGCMGGVLSSRGVGCA